MHLIAFSVGYFCLIGNQKFMLFYIFIFLNFKFNNSYKFREKMRKFRENAKCENFVKTMNFIAATINSSKELVESMRNFHETIYPSR